jgi:hypothetical protein
MRIIIALALVAATACNNSSNAPKDAAGDSNGGTDASCFTNPTTHFEIINACTTAQKIYKKSHPPLLEPDGTLPPLPQ